MTTTSSYQKDNGDTTKAAQTYPMAQNRLDGTKAALPDGATFSEHLKDDVRDIAQSATHEAGLQADKMKSAVSGYISSMEKEVIAKPTQSMAFAFAAGAVFSLLFARR